MSEQAIQGLDPNVSKPIIIVDNIHKSYLMGKEAVPALRGVSLSIQAGEFVCLMGPSGSGKTTLLLTLSAVSMNPAEAM